MAVCLMVSFCVVFVVTVCVLTLMHVDLPNALVAASMLSAPVSVLSGLACWWLPRQQPANTKRADHASADGSRGGNPARPDDEPCEVGPTEPQPFQPQLIEEA